MNLLGTFLSMTWLWIYDFNSILFALLILGQVAFDHGKHFSNILLDLCSKNLVEDFLYTLMKDIEHLLSY